MALPMVGFSSLRIATFPPDMRTDFFNQDAYDLMCCPCDLTLIGQISTAWKNVVGKQSLVVVLLQFIYQNHWIQTMHMYVHYITHKWWGTRIIKIARATIKIITVCPNNVESGKIRMVVAKAIFRIYFHKTKYVLGQLRTIVFLSILTRYERMFFLYVALFANYWLESLIKGQSLIVFIW